MLKTFLCKTLGEREGGREGREGRREGRREGGRRERRIIMLGKIISLS